MPVTAIKSITNQIDKVVFVKNRETPSDTGGEGHQLPVAPGDTLQCNMWIPWANTQYEYDNGSGVGKGPAHILISINWSSVDGTPEPPEFSIWQQGAYVRYSPQRSWSKDGKLVRGNSTVGGDRSVTVTGGTYTNADLEFF